MAADELGPMVGHSRVEEKNCKIIQTQLQAKHGDGIEKSLSWIQNTILKDSADVKNPNDRNSMPRISCTTLGPASGQASRDHVT